MTWNVLSRNASSNRKSVVLSGINKLTKRDVLNEFVYFLHISFFRAKKVVFNLEIGGTNLKWGKSEDGISNDGVF